MSLIEYVNHYNLKKIIKLYPTLIKNEFDLFENSENGIKYYNNLYPILSKYLSKINNINEQIGHVKINYIPSKQDQTIKGKNLIPKKTKGRIYPENGIGLVAFPRNIRNYLMHDTDGKPIVVDVDIKNCHPVIYYQWLLKDGYDKQRIPLLSDYIAHRDNWILLYGKQIKEEIIAVLNCCQKLMIATNSDKLENLIKEIWATQDWIRDKYNLTHLKDVKSFIYNNNTRIEREIIDIAIDYTRTALNDQNAVCVYAYDGFCIKSKSLLNSEGVIPLDFFDKLSEVVFTNTGYSVKFVNKPLEIDPKLRDYLDNNSAKNSKDKVLHLDHGKFISDYIPENLLVDFKEDILVFKSGMGDGKTWKIYNDLNKIQGVTSISILNRISLIDNVKYDYPFVYSYREPTEMTEQICHNIHGVGRSTVICCESLYRLTDATRLECKYLILDEIMSLLPQMICSETHKKNIKCNQENFLGLIKSVEKIIILDANITQDAIDFIKNIRGRGTVRQWEVAPRRHRKVFMGDEEEVLEKLNTSLLQGNKVFIACTRSVDFGNGLISTFKQRFPDLKMVYINSRNKSEDAISELLSKTEKWKEYDLVMISPCISTGVSCTVRDHFDECFAFFSNKSTNPLDSSQQIGRIRHPKTNNVYVSIHIAPTNTGRYRLGVRTEDQVLKMLYHNTHGLYSMNADCIDTKFDYSTFMRTLEHSPRLDLFVHNYASQSKLYTLYEYYFRQAMENTYICEYILGSTNPEDDTMDTGKELQFEIKEEVKISKEDYAKQIFTAPNITQSEADLLEVNQTHQNNFSYKKFIYACKLSMGSYDLDNFTKANITDDKGWNRIKNNADANIIPTVKNIKEYVFASTSGTFEKDKNEATQSLSNIFNPILKITNPVYSPQGIQEDADKLFKARVLKFNFITQILQSCWGSEYLYQTLKITQEEFDQGFDKFKKWYYSLCNPLPEQGVFNYHRVRDLFGVSYRNQKEFDKLDQAKRKDMINSILSSAGLIFRTIGTKRVRKGDKREYINQGLVLELVYPVLLNRYLEIAPPSSEKSDWNLTPKYLPVITSGSIPVMSEEWMTLYKGSVFYQPLKTCKEKNKK